MAKVKIKINDQEFEVEEEKTILEVSRELNLDIPSLCSHPDLEVRANCRICMVEIKGQKSLTPACQTMVKDGLEIITDSERIKKARKTNLEFIRANHQKSCDTCLWKEDCQLKKLFEEYNITLSPYEKIRPNKKKKYQFGPVILDASKCIECRNCVEVCQNQGISFLEVNDYGSQISIKPSDNSYRDCTYCGQCVSHCPANALVMDTSSLKRVEKMLAAKKLIIIVQIAPSVRATLNEEFKIPYGKMTPEHIAGALKQLGFKYVFDTSTGADFTTFEEAKELIERLNQHKNLPMLTSCCPAWVKYVEFYRPELIPLLTTVRSPHIIMGGYLKTYWLKKQKINSKNIKVISIMPCLAKKYEIERPELRLKNGLKPVDEVLTVRELAILLKKKNIDLKEVAKAPLDALASGAGIIYGASGGVMESALRTAYYLMTQKEPPMVQFEAVRGIEGFKKARYQINQFNLKVAVVSGLNQAEKLIQDFKAKPNLYDYIEVMACPGGCIGGGGLPLPTNKEVRQKRASVLYQLDEKAKIRCSHNNPVLKEAYQDYFMDKKTTESVFHTHFQKKKKEGYKINKR